MYPILTHLTPNTKEVCYSLHIEKGQPKISSLIPQLQTEQPQLYVLAPMSGTMKQLLQYKNACHPCTQEAEAEKRRATPGSL